MLYSLLTFFGLQYFFENYLISGIVGFCVLIIENTKIITQKKGCGCATKKPQQDR
jgi:hypothetical protein